VRVEQLVEGVNAWPRAPRGIRRSLVALVTCVVHAQVDGQLGKDADAINMVAPVERHLVEVHAPTCLK